MRYDSLSVLNVDAWETILPLQEVWVPLQDPFAWQRLADDPFKTNPLSQLKETLFGKVVLFPVKKPFKGTASRPQSLAINKEEAKQKVMYVLIQK